MGRGLERPATCSQHAVGEAGTRSGRSVALLLASQKPPGGNLAASLGPHLRFLLPFAISSVDAPCVCSRDSRGAECLEAPSCLVSSWAESSPVRAAGLGRRLLRLPAEPLPRGLGLAFLFAQKQLGFDSHCSLDPEQAASCKICLLTLQGQERVSYIGTWFPFPHSPRVPMTRPHLDMA